MTTDNGGGTRPTGPPEGAVILTASLLEQTARRWVQVPALSRKVARMTDARLIEVGLLGEHDPDRAAKAAALREHGVWVQLQGVGALEAATMGPMIPGAESWPDDQEGRAAAFRAWHEALPPDERTLYNARLQAGMLRFLSAGVLTPRLEPEQCTLFADDQGTLTTAIQELSGMVPLPPRVEEPADAAAAEEAAPAAVEAAPAA